MDFEIKMPDLSTTEAEVVVIGWLVEVNQKVKRGQALLEIETDKASMEVESVVSGVLKQVLAQPDDRVEVGQVVAIIETDDQPPSDASTSEAAAQTVAGGEPVSETPPPPPPAAVPGPARGGLFARNRESARAGGDAASAEPPSIAVSPSHRRAAERLQQSQQTVPHFYLQTSASAENLIARRAACSGTKTAWDAFFVYAAARALKRHDRMAYRYEDGKLIRQPSDAVGVAVDVDGDLFVVPITDPASQTPEQISDRLRQLVERLRSGDPEARRIRPGWMTVSNLGVSGVESFAAIVNPPESAVMAVAKIAPVPVARQNQVVIEQRVNLTLAIDHRVVSGRYAADFLNSIVQELESLAKDLP